MLSNKPFDGTGGGNEGGFAPGGYRTCSSFSRAWRFSPSPSGPAAGSLYVFLPNGTLLETSCVETYRIATWTSDAANPMKLEIQEDNRPAFAATFSVADNNTLHMTQALMLGPREVKEITLTGMEKEFVCPDMKK